MTKLFNAAIEAVGHLPSQEQDEIARTIFGLVNGRSEPQVLSNPKREAVEVLLEQAERGEFASAEQIRSVVAKHARWRLGSW